MKLKAAIIGSMLVVMSIAFAACGDADDGKITTTKAPASSVVTTTRRPTTTSTTNRPIMDEMSSAAGDVSEGRLKERANAIAGKADRPPMTKIVRNKLRAAAYLAGAAVTGAGITAAVTAFFR